MGAFFAIIILIAIVIIFFTVSINYISSSIFLYTNLNQMNCKHAMMAWIPIYNNYLFGKMVHMKKSGVFILFGTILFLISLTTNFHTTFINKPYNEVFFFFINIIDIILYICIILKMIFIYKVFKNTLPKYRIILTILNVLTYGIIGAIVLIIVRKNYKYNENRLSK